MSDSSDQKLIQTEGKLFGSIKVEDVAMIDDSYQIMESVKAGND